MTKTLTMRIPQKMEWSVDTPALLNDIIPNAMQKETISPSILVIFRNLLAEVAQRATELHDPQLDILMLRLNLYEMEGKNGGEKNHNRVKMIEVLKKEYLKKQHLKIKKKLGRRGKRPYRRLTSGYSKEDAV